jgi:2-polyprenyl-6-hydroxyphenyl methylase/3-demethylubiquinone-9 3-methyltransferase
MTHFSGLMDGKIRPLDRFAPFRSLHSCKICGGHAVPFDSVDFNKFCSVDDFYKFGQSGIVINYHRCLSCSFIFTEDFDDWSKEDFSAFIYNADYVLVDPEYISVRPVQFAADFAERFQGCESARILDYGSGSGVFVRLMREHGFENMEGYDPFSSPERPAGVFDIITCFEVIEHSCDPVKTLAEMKSFLRNDGCIIFSQTTQPADILSLRGNWWYLAPRNGHVSTYSEESLIALGRRCDLVLHKGANVYGLGPAWPSSYAHIALNWVGPSFTTLRLLAPAEVASHPIAFPTSNDVFWEPMQDDGVWQHRKAVGDVLLWDGFWPPVSRLQIRVPVLRESRPGLALRCEIALNSRREKVWMDRGEMIAEFDVAGCTSGQIALYMPEPEAEFEVAGNDRGWLDIAASLVPIPALRSQAPFLPSDSARLD